MSGEHIKSVVYPAITAAALLLVWVVGIQVFDVPNYILPSPGEVFDAMVEGYVYGAYWPHFFFTLQITVYGYLTGCGLALAVGALLAESRAFERFVYPYIVALQSTPKVAIAPLILVWLGFGMASKVVMVALMCFFPVFVNTVAGIRQTRPEALDLMRVCSASRLYVFRHVKLPSAAGHIFSGLQISVVLGLIGAVVSEFVSSTQGLGYLIQAASVNMDVATMFACLFSLVAIGLGGMQLMRALQRRCVFWEKPADAAAGAH